MVKQILIRGSLSHLSNGELKSNLGDVLRTSILMNCLDKEAIWASDEKSKKILGYFIDKRKIITTLDELPKEYKQKDVEIYNAGNNVFNEELFKSLNGKWKGYLFYPGSICLSPENEQIKMTEPYTLRKSNKSWQENLISGMGLNWDSQDYPSSKLAIDNRFDIGLNYQVAGEWTTKMWPKKNWLELYQILSHEGMEVKWQEGENNFDQYINWINSCKTIVTNESLGLHLASALRKKVVALVGPVESNEQSYNRVKFIRPSEKECMPCNAPKCRKSIDTCLGEISPYTVAGEILSNYK